MNAAGGRKTADTLHNAKDNLNYTRIVKDPRPLYDLGKFSSPHFVIVFLFFFFFFLLVRGSNRFVETRPRAVGNGANNRICSINLVKVE